MSTSRLPAAETALVNTFTAGMPTTSVIYGPFVTVPDGDYLTVGWTPEGDRSTGQQQWAGLGNRARDEHLDIPCYIDSYSGTTDVQARLAAAFALLAVAETALRADPALGGVLPPPGWSEIGPYSIYQEQTDAGLAVGVVFHVLARARI